MRRPFLVLTAMAALAAPAAAPAERASPEARLARALDGRVAGEPVRCLDTRRFASTRIIDGTAILYEAPGGTLYVNRPSAGQRSLSSWDVLVTDQYSSELCRGDVVRLFDSGSMIQSGTVFLGEFVPYSRPRR